MNVSSQTTRMESEVNLISVKSRLFQNSRKPWWEWKRQPYYAFTPHVPARSHFLQWSDKLIVLHKRLTWRATGRVVCVMESRTQLHEDLMWTSVTVLIVRWEDWRRWVFKEGESSQLREWQVNPFRHAMSVNGNMRRGGVWRKDKLLSKFCYLIPYFP